MNGLVVGDDGLARCAWALSTADYVAYHDDEWGRVVHGERELFERLSLEAFQSGLSWITILRKRPAFRTAFAEFDPDTVAGFDEDDVTRLLADTGIVRNRAKILATVANARAVCDLRASGGLDQLIWAHAPDPAARPTPATFVTTTDAALRLSQGLRSHGLRFVGPVTAYSLMQACGLVDDHLAGCHVTPAVTAGRPR